MAVVLLWTVIELRLFAPLGDDLAILHIFTGYPPSEEHQYIPYCFRRTQVPHRLRR